MYAGIDCGTQGTKVVIFDGNKNRLIGQGYAPHDLISGDDGTREQHPDWWVAAFITAFRKALSSANITGDAIEAMGVSGQQHGLVVLDEKDEVIRPAKLWCDTSTHLETTALINTLGGKQAVIEETGLMLATGYTASKLLWIKQNEPDNYKKIRSILLPHDYINFWLTGEKTAEYGDASGTGYFDTKSRSWSSKVLNAIDSNSDLNAYLPRLIQSQQPAGRLTEKAASVLGLKPGTIVASGGGDNMMGAIGTGNVSPGCITMSLGTSGTLYAHTDTPCVDQDGLIAGFCSSSNAWLPLICTMNVTNVTSMIRRLFIKGIQQFNYALESTEVGAGGLMTVPFINGERTPDLPEARGAITGISASNFTSDNLCRAFVEGASFGLKYGLELFQEQGLRGSEIRLVGGGSKSPGWQQIIANIMDMPVALPKESEAAALGAALQAKLCLAHDQGHNTSLSSICAEGVSILPGSVRDPEPAMVSAYRDLYQQYSNLKQQLYS